jgi:hypothetical protein
VKDVNFLPKIWPKIMSVSKSSYDGGKPTVYPKEISIQNTRTTAAATPASKTPTGMAPLNSTCTFELPVCAAPVFVCLYAVTAGVVFVNRKE